jgi:Glycosyltransferase family 87
MALSAELGIRRVLAQPELLAVLAVGAIARIVLIPLSHGQDFTVWDKATAATLHGVNIYAHHPDYPGGPFAYLPLVLYIELPFQWLALHTGISFTLLGKLPIAVGDFACSLLIAKAVGERGGGRRTVALAAGAFLLNPLVLYNSAYYGRFDSVACALLLLALLGLRRSSKPGRAAAWYALAVAAKTFPVFAAAGFLRANRGRRVRVALTVAAVLAALLLPYLGSLRAIATDVIGYDAGKFPGGLSWQTLLLRLVDADDAWVISILLLGLFCAATVWLSSRIDDLEQYVLVTLILFLCLSKVVLEQYLTWPMPWLTILAFAPRAMARRSSAMLLTALTAIGCWDNETFHPLGRSSTLLSLVLLAACAGYLGVLLASDSVPGRDRKAALSRTLPDGN